MTKDQTSDRDLWRQVLGLASLSIPLAVIQFGIIAIGLVETIVMGRTTPAALAGVALGRSLGFFAFSLCLGIGGVAESIIAQAVGGGDRSKATTTYQESMVWTLLAAGLSCVLQFMMMEVSAYFVQSSIYIPEKQFTLAQMPGVFFTAAFLIHKSFLQSDHNVRPLVISIIVANVANALSCPLLVLGGGAFGSVGLGHGLLGPRGALGAGIASSLAQLVLVLSVLAAGRAERAVTSINFLKLLKVPVNLTIPRLAFPLFIHFALEIGVFTVVVCLASGIGVIAASASQIILALENFFFMGALGVGAATTVLVGHAAGAGSHEVGRRGFVGIAICVIYGLLAAILISASASQLAHFFCPDPRVEASVITLIPILAFFIVFDAGQAAAASALRGIGIIKFSLCSGFICHFLVGLPLAYWLCFGLSYGVHGLWTGISVGLALSGFIMAVKFGITSKNFATSIPS